MLRTFLSASRASFSRWKPSWIESLFLVPTLFLAMAFELYGDDFGKRGIPIQLPAFLGSIPNFQPKLFPMEIYLAWVGTLTLTQIRRWPRRFFWTRLTGLVGFLIAFALLRALPDLRANPMLVVRNCAFAWYLFLPVMVALFPIPSLKWEGFFQFLYIVSFAYFVLCLLNPFLEHNPGRIFWFIDLGLMFALAYGLTTAGKWPGRLALAAIGFLLGLSYFSAVQRTTLIGLVLTITLLILSPVLYGKFPRPRWRRAIFLPLGIFACILVEGGIRAIEAGQPSALLDQSAQEVKKADPRRRSENNSQGLELFRYHLWQDAWDQFRSSPLVGIGFLKPVVFRVYGGQGRFFDNSGSFEYFSQQNFQRTTPPISGPHNSYLNAVARLGIIGFGFLLLHLACAWLFLSRCYFACFFILLWQMLYAFFNVSLEGPIRSFPLLVLVGVALKLAIENFVQQAEGQLAGQGPLPLARRPRASKGTSPKVGVVHVPYRFVGGEDQHVTMLFEAYRDIGISPVAIPGPEGSPDLLFKAARSLTMGKPETWDEIMRGQGIDFLHLNNIHATLGPAFLRWIIERRIPALMTVHNHRFYCTNGLALYGTEVCKACRPHASFLRPIARNCNGSLPKSIYHSAALVEIRGDDLLRRAVTQFLAPSPYIARELQVAGMPTERIRVFPHPVEVGSIGSTREPVDVAFVGRLSPEKGVLHLLDAARRMKGTSFVLAGEGPLESAATRAAADLPNVRFLGKLRRTDALAVMQAAKVVCVPSVCHESFSLVAAEAAALGARLVVPDSQSFRHYAEAPFDAVTAIVTNPESLVYSLEMALGQPRHEAAVVEEIRDRYGAEGFRARLKQVVEEVILR